MATVIPHSLPIDLEARAGEAARRRPTNHLKVVPESKPLREQLRAACAAGVARLDRSQPLAQDAMERLARRLLTELRLPEGYVGWTMVVLASQFWREQVAAVPAARRLLLLPPCPRHDDGDEAAADEPADCQIAEFRRLAESLGYRTIVTDNSAAMLTALVGGEVDAILGVASLNVLEKAIDRVLSAGVACMAVPLLAGDDCGQCVDADWVTDMIRLEHRPSSPRTGGYLPLMRAAAAMFHPDELQRLVPRLRGGPSLAEANGQGIAGLDPVAGTEAIAYDFLAKGGKHSRPFITLAVYDAMTGGLGAGPRGAEHVAAIPDAVRRTALSIETFHKASLVHDDIEDDDRFRYGEPTLHRRFGLATAINVGDYLIGLGYRLVSRESRALGTDVVADILDRLADAHMKLAEGQGAELLWRDSRDKRLTPREAIRIYALKTAPAFEAALHAGLRLAAPLDPYLEPIHQFARNLGVAFQILNDLGDWRGDNFNKLTAGGDVLGGRPTVLWALALEASTEENRRRLEQLAAEAGAGNEKIQEVRQLYQAAGVFDKALDLVEKHRRRAESAAEGLEPEPLRRLLGYLIETVLEA